MAIHVINNEREAFQIPQIAQLLLGLLSVEVNPKIT